MLSFLPEMPLASGLFASSAGLAPPAAGTATSADFAGLLDAALPSGGEVTGGAAGLAPALPATAPALTPGTLPGGNPLPLPGSALPPLTAEAELSPDAGEPNPLAATPASAPAARLLRERGGTLAGAPRAAVPLEQVQGETAPPGLASPAVSTADELAPSEASAAPSEDQTPPSPNPAGAPLVTADPADAPTAIPTGDEPPALATTLATNPAPGAATLVLAIAPPPPALTPPPPRAEALPMIKGTLGGLPAKAALAAADPVANPASAAAPMLQAEDAAAPAPGARPAEGLPEAPAQPAIPAPAAPQLAAVTASLPQAGPQPAATTTEPAAPPAPTIEDTIAQADTLREALRAQRPELTLRHAEFGAVSLRLEATGTESWRAVLSARDPGFVPAIQAALAERSVAAASPGDADSFLSQNGTSDQRYGASPNGGQGGHSPHFGQSGTRDGETAPDHRRPSTAATLAGRDQMEAGGDGSGSSPARQSRGLFA